MGHSDRPSEGLKTFITLLTQFSQNDFHPENRDLQALETVR